MYTVSMIIDYIGAERITSIHIVPDDFIKCIRADNAALMKKETLYISPGEKDMETMCRTAAGSSFVVHESMSCAFNCLLDALDFFSDWQADLIKISENGCTLTELLDTAYPMLKHPLFILNNEQYMIANSPDADAIDLQSRTDLTELFKNKSSNIEKIAAFNRLYSDYFKNVGVYKIPGDVFTETGYAFNLFHNRMMCGILVIEYFDDMVTQGMLDLFRILGHHIQDMINVPSNGLVIENKDPAFLRYYLSPTVENAEIMRHELFISNWNDEDAKQIICISHSDDNGISPNLNYAHLIFSRMPWLKAAKYKECVILLLNIRILDENESYNEITQRISQLAYYAGASEYFEQTDKIPLMIRRAQAALENGDQRPGAINYFEKNFLRCFFSMMEKEDIELLQHPILEKISLYDARNGSRLYETVYYYLKNERNITDTAREMKLHRNTLIHRIERIEEITQGILDDPEERLHIMLSFYQDLSRVPVILSID